MREVFQQELAEVSNGLVEIARHVESAMQRAAVAFTNSDVALAEQVISDDARIDELAIALDEHTIEIIARQSPVARDLRLVVSALRISSSLERMGDLAAHIAALARYRFPGGVGPNTLRPVFAEMSRLDVAVARQLVALLDAGNDEETNRIADEIKASDNRIDELHRSTFDALLADDIQAQSVEVVDATLASRYFERFADHAVSIAQKVQYLTSGEWMQEKEPSTPVSPITPGV
ncbi:phosphate signaling complex protein PhoU [Pseudoclavibacter helvolus]|uniref:Phosphate-specific transport system accessory protein PhoU n=1 Tax=Pseudoclavibacter helvolus TaxID=255205 RepID=A0A7W4UQQ3_9MICO|nr:phosphate signaling complex protein PhoU [Pseudoclavibacter helvolus]MBB2958811.1 phosphate transport system protein [Pseudoclavibacter helvolus]